LKSDEEALAFSTEYERAVIHFFHPEFARCNTMDAHCQQISESHAEHRDGDIAFARIDVKNAPFVVEKLGIRVLPSVLGFLKGVVKGRVTGFEGLCWDGKEGSIAVTRALEETFVSWTILRKRLILAHGGQGHSDDDDDERPNSSQGRRGISGPSQKVGDDEDDWD
jgi:hypothetical protein